MNNKDGKTIISTPCQTTSLFTTIIFSSRYLATSRKNFASSEHEKINRKGKKLLPEGKRSRESRDE